MAVMTFQLLLAWALVALIAASSVLARRLPGWMRFAAGAVFVAGLSLALMPLIGSPLDPHFPDAAGRFETQAVKVLSAIWWLLVARLVIAGGRIAIERQQRAMHFASDLAAGAVYLAASLAILDMVFGVSVMGLVATSGIIAIVVGLALQSTLSDLFSGVAIGIDRPFKVGDVVSLDGTIEGRIVETSWRSMRLVTPTDAVATVPNSIVAKSRILNKTSPNDRQTGTVKFTIDPAVPTADAIAVLRGAHFSAFPLSTADDPAVVCTELRGDGAVYHITFSAPLARFDAVRSDLFHQVSRHLRYAGIALAPQTAAVPRTAPTALQSLGDVPLMLALTGDELAELAAGVCLRDGPAGATIFEQNGSLASLFVIARGAFEVVRDEGAGPRRLGTIGPGDYFGELALLTGLPNTATVRALTPFAVFEVTKATIAPLLARNPALLQALEDAAAKAQALLDRTIAAHATMEMQTGVPLLHRIRDFFDLRSDAWARPALPPAGAVPSDARTAWVSSKRP